jgi:hypothetical protein
MERGGCFKKWLYTTGTIWLLNTVMEKRRAFQVRQNMAKRDTLGHGDHMGAFSHHLLLPKETESDGEVGGSKELFCGHYSPLSLCRAARDRK